MAQRLRGNEYRTTVVCVDSYDNQVPVGRFYNPGLEAEVPFHSLSQLLVRIEDLLDEMQFPQSFTLSRAFSASGPESRADSASPAGERMGKRATFAVRILFRQNASWQGSVTWLESGREESFRSVLELILLMDSAMVSEKQNE